MSRAIPSRLTKSLGGAFLTLLAWNLVAPGQSLAGCVHDRPSVSHFEGLIGAGAMDRSIDEILSPTPKTPPGQVPTCTGPLCSRGPAAPTPAPWATALTDDSRAITGETSPPVASPSARLAPESTPFVPSAPGTSIFHPPRASTI